MDVLDKMSKLHLAKVKEGIENMSKYERFISLVGKKHNKSVQE